MEPTTAPARPAPILHKSAPALAVVFVVALTFVVIPVIIAVNPFLAIPVAIALTIVAAHRGNR